MHIPYSKHVERAMNVINQEIEIESVQLLLDS